MRSLSYLITAFFQKHLVGERGLSPHTIASYSDGIKLLILFAEKRFQRPPEKLDINAFDRAFILDFLDDLECNRNNSASTRNQRLAAIKTFFRYCGRNVPELLHLNETIQVIGTKRCETKPPPSLTSEEVGAILDAADTSRVMGARNRALVQLLYQSGARVQEIADLRMENLRFESPASVTLTGKGQKTRIIPLQNETVEAIKHYLDVSHRTPGPEAMLFINNKGVPLTRFGIGHIVEKMACKAAETMSSLRGRRITPHVFRHSLALHLVESGSDIVIVQEWLGHAHLSTVSQYVEVSIARKKAALDALPAPSATDPPQTPQWKQNHSIYNYLDAMSKGIMLPNPLHPSTNTEETSHFAT